jgi:ribosome-binding protein aMBF1 (putative translation factor)
MDVTRSDLTSHSQQLRVARVLEGDSERQPGRPRSNAPRCYCGKMTEKAAKAKCHHCEPDYVKPSRAVASSYARRAKTSMSCFCGSTTAAAALKLGHKCAPEDRKRRVDARMRALQHYFAESIHGWRVNRRMSVSDLADLVGVPAHVVRDLEDPTKKLPSLEILMRIGDVFMYEVTVGVAFRVV